MRYACIFCEVLFREFCLAAADSDAVIDFIQLPQGLHSVPAELRQRVQAEIDALEPGKYDAILLGYALCSNGVVGLTSQHTPLVIPRGHDCVTLLLGSKDVYREYFDSHHGIYWYSSGWIERTLQPGRERREITLAHYIEKYGEENAEYLMEMEQSWFKEYQWATYIDWGLPTAERDRAFTRECAEYLGWHYDEIRGDRKLIFDFFRGQWDPELFLLVPPGECIEPSHAPTIMKSCPGCDCHGALQMDAGAPVTNGLRR